MFKVGIQSIYITWNLFAIFIMLFFDKTNWKEQSYFRICAL